MTLSIKYIWFLKRMHSSFHLISTSAQWVEVSKSCWDPKPASARMRRWSGVKPPPTPGAGRDQVPSHSGSIYLFHLTNLCVIHTLWQLFQPSPSSLVHGHTAEVRRSQGLSCKEGSITALLPAPTLLLHSTCHCSAPSSSSTEPRTTAPGTSQGKKWWLKLQGDVLPLEECWVSAARSKIPESSRAVLLDGDTCVTKGNETWASEGMGNAQHCLSGSGL